MDQEGVYTVLLKDIQDALEKEGFFASYQVDIDGSINKSTLTLENRRYKVSCKNLHHSTIDLPGDAYYELLESAVIAMVGGHLFDKDGKQIQLNF